MINFLSSWAKGLGLSIVIVSILEMVLPNNKTKKYVRMVMGLYVIFTIVSPIIKNKDKLYIGNIDAYVNTVATSVSVNQTSMDNRIEELYIEELQKDITKKIEEKGYKVLKCKVNAKISNNENETKINLIKLNLEKNLENQENLKNNEQDESIENKIVVQVQKIKPIEIKEEKAENTNIENTDIQNIKKFLVEEYGVSEKCLKIN